MVTLKKLTGRESKIKKIRKKKKKIRKLTFGKEENGKEAVWNLQASAAQHYKKVMNFMIYLTKKIQVICTLLSFILKKKCNQNINIIQSI